MPPVVGCPHAGDSQPGDDRPRWEVADIFRLYGDTYRQTYGVSAAQQKVIDAIIACRTAQLGGHAERCPQCGVERFAYSSCRNRHCPKCQTWTTAQWVEAQRAELLPTPYCHTVFTVPHTLNTLILGNKRPLLTLLFRTASQTLLQFGRQNLDGQLGATMVLHTWDQTLNAHFHLHCLVPAGALAEDGTRWVPTHPRFLFPVQALSTVCRAKFLAAFQQAYHKEALSFAQEPAWHGSLTSFTHLLDQLYGQAWVVYAKPPCAGPVPVLEYLGRSIHRVAIANHRLRDMRNGHVRFTYRHRRQGNQGHTMTLEAHEFIRRFLLHIVPHGFQRLRHVGFPRQPVQGPRPAPMSTTAGPADRTAPTGAAKRRCMDAAADRYRHYPMSTLWPRSTGTKPSAPPHSPGAEPRGPTGGADLGLVMTLSLIGQVHIGRHRERASLAPQGAVRVRGV